MRHLYRLSILTTAALAALFLATSPAPAQWVQTSGPEGGAIPRIFADGPDLYAGTLGNAGVFKSTDGGATWEQKINGMGYQSVVAIDRCGPFLLASGTVGLYRSTDGGDTWTPADGLPPANGVYSLLVDGFTVYAGTSGKGVYVSTDSGATWTVQNTNLPHASNYTYVGGICKTPAGIIAAVTDNSIYGVYRTTDEGMTWTKIDNGLPAYTQLNSLIRSGTEVFAGSTTVFRSTDDGANWTEYGAGIPMYSGIEEVVASGSSLFAAGASTVYRSTDNGANWTTLGGGLPLMTIVSLEVSGPTVFAGTIADGIYASTDNGDTWTQRVAGLYARDMTEFLIDGGTLWGNGNGMFSTTDEGDTWPATRGDLKDSSAQPTLVYVSGSTMFCRDFPAQGIERSTDGGVTWTEIGTGLPAGGTINSMVASGGALFTVANRIYRSNDNGDSWVQIDSALGDFVYMGNITKIGSTIFAYGLGIARSTDDGATWALADTGIPEYFGVTGVTAVGSTLFCGGGFPPKNFKSTDNGDTWTAVTTLPSSSNTTQLLGYGNDLFACGENNGIFISTNLGANWTRISTGLPTPNYRYSFAIHNGMMYAGTSGNSVWKRPLSDVTAVEPVVAEWPGSFTLMQNYPNPFNPATEVRFSVPSRERVRVAIYDVLGRLAAVLADEDMAPGTYAVQWNASGEPSGVYYARMTAGSFTASTKMLLVR